MKRIFVAGLAYLAISPTLRTEADVTYAYTGPAFNDDGQQGNMLNGHITATVTFRGIPQGFTGTVNDNISLITVNPHSKSGRILTWPHANTCLNNVLRPYFTFFSGKIVKWNIDLYLGDNPCENYVRGEELGTTNDANGPFDYADINLFSPILYGDNHTQVGKWSLISTRAPEIVFNGYDNSGDLQNNLNVTGKTEDAVVGQQINLSASLPDGSKVQAQSWSIDGSPIGGFSGSVGPLGVTTHPKRGEIIPLTRSKPTITFYWVQPSAKAYHVEYDYELTDGTSGKIVTAYNVYGPTKKEITSDAVELETEYVNILDNRNGKYTLPYEKIEYLSCGNADTKACIKFKIKPSLFKKYPELNFVQVVKPRRKIEKYKSGKIFDCISPPGLDGSMPYGLSAADEGYTEDSPAIPIFDEYISETDIFNAEMYLVFSQILRMPYSFLLGMWGGGIQRLRNMIKYGKLIRSTNLHSRSFPRVTNTLLGG